ncbi:MAG: cell division protein FtsQ/DivIB [Candidatus Omnitrophota bacterium]
MARNNRNKKSLAPVIVLVILPLAAIVLSSVAITKGVGHYIKESEYFRIKDLQFQGLEDQRYCQLMRQELLGVNIFSRQADTETLVEKIQRKFPTFTEVSVTRVFPSQLRISAKERRPLAVLKRDLYYIFDEEGVALAALSTVELADYPMIIGLENKISKIRLGQQYATPLFRKTLLLARAMRVFRSDIEASLPGVRPMKITKIDATDAGNLCFYLGDTVEVRIGAEDFERRLGLLPAILKNIGPEFDQLRYVDLRPKEPVVAMRQTKKS